MKLNKNKGLAILIDPEYGQTILNNSTDADYVIGVPIEKVGAFPLSWLKDGSLYQQLLERPAGWFVKVLWHFHTQMSPEEKEVQLSQLRKLNEVCTALKRKLMIELIILEDFPETGSSLGESMSEVYQAGISPFWWKITALDTEKEWQTMTATLDKYDPDVGVIILGKNAPIEQFETWFRVSTFNSSHLWICHWTQYFLGTVGTVRQRGKLKKLKSQMQLHSVTNLYSIFGTTIKKNMTFSTFP